MGTNPSKQDYRPSSLTDPRMYRPGVSKAVNVVLKTRQLVTIVIPDDNLTCGWLLSEVIRQSKDESIIALSTESGIEILDYWLTQPARSLIPLQNQEPLLAIYQEQVQGKFVSKFNFVPMKVIGRGGFSRVTQVRSKQNGQIFAMKIMDKDFICKKEKIDQILTERDVLMTIDHPFVVKMHYCFQSENSLHIVLDFCPGGELFFHLHNLGRFTEDQARFYFCEILLGIEALHRENIIYRDLKPENILLDMDGHIRITDFGLSKTGIRLGQRTYSFCGSPEYMSPEMLRNAGHSQGVDFYALGTLLYEMLTGMPPFYDTNRDQMYKMIQYEELRVPRYISKKASNLLQQLLVKNQNKRMGSLRGVEEVKQHPWCARVNWRQLYNKKINPPFRPLLSVSNFDPEYTSIPLEHDDFSPNNDFEEENDTFNQFYCENVQDMTLTSTPPRKPNFKIRSSVRSLIVDSNQASTNVSSAPASANISSLPISTNASGYPMESESSEQFNLKDIMAVKPFSMDEFMLPDINPIPEGAVAAKFGRSSSTDTSIPPPIKVFSQGTIFIDSQARRSSETLFENEEYQQVRRFTDQLHDIEPEEQEIELIPQGDVSPVQRKRDSYVEVRSSKAMMSKQNMPTPVKYFKDQIFERESEDFSTAAAIPQFYSGLDKMKRPGTTKRISR